MAILEQLQRNGEIWGNVLYWFVSWIFDSVINADKMSFSKQQHVYSLNRTKSEVARSYHFLKPTLRQPFVKIGYLEYDTLFGKIECLIVFKCDNLSNLFGFKAYLEIIQAFGAEIATKSSTATPQSRAQD